MRALPHYAPLVGPSLPPRCTQLLMTRPRDEWKVDVSSRYKALEQYSKDAARRKFLDKLHDLPYGHAVFFPVKKVVDPVGQLPPKTILGVNTRGVHFFRPRCVREGGGARAGGRAGGRAGAVRTGLVMP